MRRRDVTQRRSLSTGPGHLGQNSTLSAIWSCVSSASRLLTMESWMVKYSVANGPMPSTYGPSGGTDFLRRQTQVLEVVGEQPRVVEAVVIDRPTIPGERIHIGRIEAGGGYLPQHLVGPEILEEVNDVGLPRGRELVQERVQEPAFGRSAVTHQDEVQICARDACRQIAAARPCRPRPSSANNRRCRAGCRRRKHRVW